MPSSSSGRTWAIKGVSDRTRDAVLEAAHAEGLTVGEWVDRALARAAEEARNPRPPAASRAEVAEVVRELLDERLAPLVERVGHAAATTPGDGAGDQGSRMRSPRLFRLLGQDVLPFRNGRSSERR